MPDEDFDMNDPNRITRDIRKWHVSKEIPVALIFSMAGALFLGGVAYQSLKSDIATGSAEVKEVKTEVRNITNKINDSAVPSEQARWRIEQAERQAAELRAGMADVSRRVGVLELRFGAARER